MLEAHEDKRDGTLRRRSNMKARAQRRLGPIDVNRHMICNLCCKARKGRNRAGHVYDSASGFCKPPGINLCL